MNEYRLEVFKKASLCRHFENKVFELSKEKIINYPVYLSAGQEFIASSLSTICNDLGLKPDIFIQHRGHSTYLAFGGSIDLLILELLENILNNISTISSSSVIFDSFSCLT